VGGSLAAIESGVIKSLYKVAGQRRVLGIVEVESHDQLDQIVMGALPMSHYLTLEEVLPVREYAAFAEDVRKRWQS
jgi:muconolactone D-isomerase